MAISVFMSSVAPPHRPLGNIREWHVLRIPEFDWQLIPLISCSKFNDSSGRIEILFEFCKIVIERKWMEAVKWSKVLNILSGLPLPHVFTTHPPTFILLHRQPRHIHPLWLNAVVKAPPKVLKINPCGLFIHSLAPS